MKIKIAVAYLIAFASRAYGHDGCPPYQPAVFIPEHTQNEPAIALDVGAWPPGMTFAFDKAELTPYTVEALKDHMKALNEYPGLQVEVAGHADSMGSKSYNQTLSDRRAAAVYEYLVHHGVNPSMLKTKGYGEDRPIAPNKKIDGSDYPCGRLRNRRVELNVMNLRRYP